MKVTFERVEISTRLDPAEFDKARARAVDEALRLYARRRYLASVEPDYLDQCVCGDFREEHENGTGPCKYNHSHHQHFGAPNCLSFRIHRTGEEVREQIEREKAGRGRR